MSKHSFNTDDKNYVKKVRWVGFVLETRPDSYKVVRDDSTLQNPEVVSKLVICFDTERPRALVGETVWYKKVLYDGEQWERVMGDLHHLTATDNPGFALSLSDKAKFDRAVAKFLA